MRLQYACLGGLQDEQQGNLTCEKERIPEESGDSESELWYYKSVAHTDESCGKPFAGETAESIFQFFRKVKMTMKRHWNISLSQAISFTEAVYDIFRKIYGRRSGDPIWAFGRKCGHVGSFHECHFRCSSSSRK